MNLVNSVNTLGHVVPSTGKFPKGHGKPRGLSEPHPISAKVMRRFWKKVEKTEECWEWDSTRDGCGYGMFGFNKKTHRAHRFSFFLHHGVIPKGIMVLHHCDNPGCVRPDHLFLGTQFDNMRDMKEKGRERKARGEANGMRVHPESTMKGEKHHKAILTEKDVLHIRANYRGSCSSMAPSYGVSTCTIRDIVKRRSWRHI